MGKPLNMDEVTWLRSEVQRLHMEAARQQKLVPLDDESKKEVAELYRRLGEKDQTIAQLNKQVDDLSEQVAKLQEQQ